MFNSKVLQRLFLKRLRTHILASPNFNQNRAAYRSGHSTETALLLLLDRIYLAADGGTSTLLMSLDLSIAFDTIDHDVLLSSLMTASVLLALLTRGSRHTSLIGVNSFVLAPTTHNLFVTCNIGVPKGSVLGPLFSIYTSPISKISTIYNV